MVLSTRRELLAGALLLGSRLRAQALRTIQIEEIDEKIRLYLLTGAGGNIVLLAGPDGQLLVDTGMEKTAEELALRLRRPVAVVINTHYHFDHVGGNAIVGGRDGARILAHNKTAKRLSETQHSFGRETPPLAPAGRPNSTYKDSGKLDYAAEKLTYRHVPRAHTDGDTIVFFENANALHTGDLFFHRRYPFIDYPAGGSIEGMIAAADGLLKNLDPKTKVIPGHGPLATPEDYRAFRNMLADVNERITKLVAEGKSLKEVQAAAPTKAYDETCGDPANFVRFVYEGKKKKKK